MKNTFITILVIVLFSLKLNAQDCNLNSNTIITNTLCSETLNQLTQGNATIVARDAVIFKPGFEVNSSSVQNHSLTVKVDHSISNQTAPFITSYAGNNGLPAYSGYIPVTMGGTVDVSPTGAATFQLPIAVSPGSKGMQPSLSVVYNSQGGNGLLGYGWNLAGLSAITRVGKSPYYDGTISGVELNNNDEFALDGVRLIKTGGAFYPSNNPYARIVFDDQSGFTLTTQDGMVLEFGRTYDSKFLGAGSNVPHTYAINRIIDINGNYIDYYYAHNASTGEYRISEINYTGNLSGAAPYNSIKFLYDRRNDTSSFYIAGKKTTTSSLISSIKVYSEGTLAKNYEFTYNEGFYSKLRMITLEADGVKYAPTIINWNDEATFSNQIENAGLGNILNQWFFGDINGDGLIDRFSISSNNIWVKFSGNTSNYTIPLPVNYSTNYGGSYLYVSYDFKAFDVLDWNGDSRDDILITFNEGRTTQHSEYTSDLDLYSEVNTIRCISFNGVSFEISDVHSVLSQPTTNITLIDPDQYKYYFADLNNDGNVNLITLKNQTLSAVSGINYNAPIGGNSIKDIRFADFNGNGKIELIILNDNAQGTVWEYNGNDLVKILGIHQNITFSNKPSNIFFGDFNGDGKTDYIGKIGEQWVLKYSTGLDFVQVELPLLINFIEVDVPINGEFDPDYQCFVSEFSETQQVLYPTLAISTFDINGDGKSDLIFSKNHFVYIALSKGDSFEIVKEISVFDYEYNHVITPAKVIFFVDTDGDGINELICGGFNHKLGENDIHIYEPFKRIEFTNFPENQYLVNTISDGIGNNYQYSYTFFRDNRLVGIDFSKPAFPLTQIRGPLKVVGNLTASTTQGVLSNISYSYSNAQMHLHGLGFLGFKKVEAMNLVDGTSSESFYSYEVEGADNVFSPWLQKQIVRNGSQVQSIVESTMEPIGGSMQQKMFMHLPKTITTTDFNGKIKRTTNSYNAQLGRLVSQSEVVGSWSTTKDFTYTSFGANTSRIRNVRTVTYGPDDPEPFIQNAAFAYSETNPFRVVSTTEQGVATTFTGFDTFGNETSINREGRVNSNTYDNNGRFVISATDFSGLTSNFSYRNTDGAILSETNPQGLVTQHAYSFAGGSLVTTTTLPDGRIVRKTLGWDSSDGATFFKSSQITGGNQISEYYNSIGQKVSETALGYQGANLTVRYQYNSKGELISEVKSGIATPTLYSYDNYGRITSVTGHNNLSVSYSYTPNSVTANSSIAGSETKYFDDVGNVTKVVSAQGTLKYKYFASGKQKEIDAEGAVTSMTFDEKGNQLTLLDPSAGLTSFAYNKFNELISQTDTKGQTTSITYDGAGRVTAKTGTDFSEAYTYYPDGKQKGMLHTASRNGAVTEEYQYDEMGRVSKKKLMGFSKEYETIYQYSTIGRIERVMLPTGITLTYEYDAIGNLVKIFNSANPSTPIWHGNSKNERDQWEKFTLGNGVETVFTYDKNHMLRGISAVNTRNSSPVMNLGFTFNYKGQLLNRYENALHEDFKYDDQNRLTSSVVLGKDPYNVIYNRNGNISETSLVGKYEYLANKPFAVSQVLGNGATQQSPVVETFSTFTADNRIAHMDNGTYRNEFVYGPSGFRFMVDHLENKVKKWTKVYVDNCEFIYDADGNLTETRTILNAPTGTFGVYRAQAGTKGEFLYVHTDYLGSWLCITNSAAQVVNRYSYDAWGRPRNPKTWELLPVDITNALANLMAMQPLFDRGYTGHEHMCGFGLINMNGRLYDPYLQRFLSPDPYVQEPFNLQNYNRYAYCLNNPLMYTDPSGEFFWLIPAAVGFVTGYISHGIKTGNWGWRAVGAGFVGAGVALMAFYSGGTSSAAYLANSVTSYLSSFGIANAWTGGVSVALGFSVHYAASAALTTAFSSIIPSISIPLSRNFCLNVSMGIGFSPSGLVGGASISLTYFKGKNSYTLGGGVGTNHVAWGFSASFNNGGFGIGYHRSYYGDAIGPDGNPNPQNYGSIQLMWRNGSFRLENDLFAPGNRDRWRTFGAELQIGDFVVGSTIYTNAPDRNARPDDDYSSSFWGFIKGGKRSSGTYSGSEVFSSPLYIGLRSGNIVSRVGWDHPVFQDIFQNGMHLLINSPLFYTPKYSRGYWYSGYYNPFSLF